jgi:hypothetical protein
MASNRILLILHFSALALPTEVLQKQPTRAVHGESSVSAISFVKSCDLNCQQGTNGLRGAGQGIGCPVSRQVSQTIGHS